MAGGLRLLAKLVAASATCLLASAAIADIVARPLKSDEAAAVSCEATLDREVWPSSSYVRALSAEGAAWVGSGFPGSGALLIQAKPVTGFLAKTVVEKSNAEPVYGPNAAVVSYPISGIHEHARYGDALETVRTVRTSRGVELLPKDAPEPLGLLVPTKVVAPLPEKTVVRQAQEVRGVGWLVVTEDELLVFDDNGQRLGARRLGRGMWDLVPTDVVTFPSGALLIMERQQQARVGTPGPEPDNELWAISKQGLPTSLARITHHVAFDEGVLAMTPEGKPLFASFGVTGEPSATLVENLNSAWPRLVLSGEGQHLLVSSKGIFALRNKDSRLIAQASELTFNGEVVVAAHLSKSDALLTNNRGGESNQPLSRGVGPQLRKTD